MKLWESLTTISIYGPYRGHLQAGASGRAAPLERSAAVDPGHSADAAREHGTEGLMLQDIAAAAGISHPLILHHFGSRGGLIRADPRGRRRVAAKAAHRDGFERGFGRATAR